MKKKLLIVGGVLGLLLIINIINAYYPFRSVRPNYKDVEATFDRIKFPADWVQTDHSEDKGIAGRACPPEGSGCFHKSRTFSIPNGTSYDLIKQVIETSGCAPVGYSRYEQIGGVPHANLECSINGLSVGASVHENIGKWEITVGANT